MSIGHAFLGVEGPNGGRWNNATGSNNSNRRSNNNSVNERHNSSPISGTNSLNTENSFTSNTVDADDCTFSVSYR